jgi:hypothetical protein
MRVYPLALRVVGLPEPYARLFPERDGPVGRRDAGDAVAQKALEFVNVVRAFAAAARVLAVHWIDAQTPGTYTKNERVLHHIFESQI